MGSGAVAWGMAEGKMKDTPGGRDGMGDVVFGDSGLGFVFGSVDVSAFDVADGLVDLGFLEEGVDVSLSGWSASSSAGASSPSSSSLVEVS